jgi:uncharacterized phage-associated protein
MHFRFDFEKTLQASGLLLNLDGGRMGRIRLLKLLYIADRELLAESGRTLTGDSAVAMKHGPVLGRVHDLIKDIAGTNAEWSDHLGSVGYQVILKKDPGRKNLTRREIDKLMEVTDRYRSYGEFDLSEYTHGFEEWSKHYQPDTSTTIDWEEILKAQGKTDLIEIVERDEEDRRELEQLFGRDR